MCLLMKKRYLLCGRHTSPDMLVLCRHGAHIGLSPVAILTHRTHIQPHDFPLQEVFIAFPSFYFINLSRNVNRWFCGNPDSYGYCEYRPGPGPDKTRLD